MGKFCELNGTLILPDGNINVPRVKATIDCLAKFRYDQLLSEGPNQKNTVHKFKILTGLSNVNPQDSADRIRLLEIQHIIFQSLDTLKTQNRLGSVTDKDLTKIKQLVSIETYLKDGIENTEWNNILSETQKWVSDKTSDIENTNLDIDSIELSVYAPSPGQRVLRRNQFKIDALRMVYISQNGVTLNHDDWYTNQNIVKYKNQLYKTIATFVNAYTGDLYTWSRADNSYTYNSKADEIINRFAKRLENGEFDSQSLEGDYLNAVNALFNLLNFDKQIGEILGRKLSPTRITNRNFSKYNVPYKVQFVNEMNIGWWSAEITNALEEVGGAANAIFSMIPYYDNGIKQEGLTISLKDLTNAFFDFFDKFLSSGNISDSFKRQVRGRKFDPNKVIIEMFFHPQYDSIVNSLSNFEKNILNSFKRWAYVDSVDGTPFTGSGINNNSIYNKIATLNLQEQSILDIALNTLMGLQRANYQETTYKVNNYSGDTKQIVQTRAVQKVESETFDYRERLISSVNNARESCVISMIPKNNLITIPGTNTKIPYTEGTFYITHGSLFIAVSSPDILKHTFKNFNIQVWNNGVDITNRLFTKEGKNLTINSDFGTNAISNNAIQGKYKPVFGYMRSVLEINESNSEKIFSLMQAQFAQNSLGFGQMLVDAIQTDIIKHIQQFYNSVSEQQGAFQGQDITHVFSMLQDDYVTSYQGNKERTFKDIPLQYCTINLSNDQGHKYQTLSYGPKFIPFNAYSSWASAYGQALKSINGTQTASTIKNAAGNNDPTVKSVSMINETDLLIQETMTDRALATNSQVIQSRTVAANLFTQQLSAVGNTAAGTNIFKGTRYDQEVTDIYGKVKKVSDMTAAELVYHGIFDNFYSHYFDDNNAEVFIKSATYSDKTTEAVARISASTILQIPGLSAKTTLGNITREDAKLLFQNTVGKYYYRYMVNTLHDLASIFSSVESCPIKIGNDFSEATDPDTRAVTMTVSLNNINIDNSDKVLKAAQLFNNWAKSYINKQQKINGKTFQYLEDNNLIKEDNGQYSVAVTTTDPNTQESTTTWQPVIVKRGLTEQELTNRASANHTNIYKYMQYEICPDGTITINPLGMYLATIQYSDEYWNQRWQKEEYSFIDTLLKNNFQVKLEVLPESDEDDLGSYEEQKSKKLASSFSFDSFFSHKNTESWRIKEYDAQGKPVYWNRSDWVMTDASGTGRYMILAKAIDKTTGNVINISRGRLQQYINSDYGIIINPMLDHFYHIENVLSCNLRNLNFGSELSDPAKWEGYAKAKQTIIDNIQAELNSVTEQTQQLILQKKLDKYQTMTEDDFRNTISDNIMDIAKYSNMFHDIEANIWNTSNKRTVTGPGTMTPYILGTKNGTQESVNIAFIEDLKAATWFFTGKDGGTLDSMDGSTFSHPLQAIWEINSLDAKGVTMDKKTLGQWIDPQTGATIVEKHAQYAITNERMRMGINSEVPIYDIFKQMSLQSFSSSRTFFYYSTDENGNSIKKTVSLAPNQKSYAGFTINNQPVTNYQQLKTAMDNYEQIVYEGNSLTEVLLVSENGYDIPEGLYYQDSNGYNKIISLNWDPEAHAYYTTEEDEEGVFYNYQLFDNNNESHNMIIRDDEDTESSKVLEYMKNNSYHTIDNVFELHKALGGIYTVTKSFDSKTGRDIYIGSEGSNVIAAQIINNACVEQTVLSKDKSHYIYNYIQPYKNKIIHYLGNQSGSKRAIPNINSRDFWHNPAKLNYSTFKLLHYGVQLNADHEKEAAEITTPTQVIAALAQGGRLHNRTKRLYEALGNLVKTTCQLELGISDKILKVFNDGKDFTQQEKMDIVEAIGTVAAAHYSQRNDAELGSILIEGMKLALKDPDRSFNNITLPFSDATLFSSLGPSLATTLNSKGVKPSMYGLGMVMSPGYGYVQTFYYDGEKHMAEDVYEDALYDKEFQNYINDSNTPINRTWIESSDYAVRRKRTVATYLEYKQDQLIKNNPDGDSYTSFIPSDNICLTYTVEGSSTVRKAYIKLQDIKTYYKVIEAIESSDYNTLQKYFTKDSSISSKKIDKIKGYYQDVKHGRDLAPERITFTMTDSNGQTKQSNIFLLDKIRQYKDNDNVPKRVYQNILNQLYLGKYTDSDNKVWNISNFTTQSAENVMPNLYEQQFGIKGMSLLQAKRYLQETISAPVNINYRGDYDLAFISLQGDSTFLSFNKPPKNNRQEGLYAKKLDWNNVVAVEEEGIRWIYRRDKSNNLLNKVGYVDNRGKYKYFVNKYIVSQSENGNQNKEYIHININLQALLNITNDDNAEAVTILQDLYKDDHFNSIELGENANETIYNLGQALSNDVQIQEYLTAQYDHQQSRLTDEQFTGKKKQFYKQQKQHLLSSFEKSLNSLADRIPTATLQSFMKMKTVGFTQVSNNRIYVSHFQSWLQGSDYDIDKAYIMGFNINRNGKFLGWSDLFNYESIETLNASCSLPMPKGAKFEYDADGIDINEFAKEAKQAIESVNFIAKIKVLNKIFDKLDYDFGETVKIKYSNGEVFEPIRQLLNQHESTKLVKDKDKIYQNFISVNAQEIVEDTRNLLDSYNPTSVDGIKKAAAKMEDEGADFTSMNNAAKWVLQEQNLVGKNVISVAANAQKVYFNLYSYYTDIMKYPYKYDPVNYKFATKFNHLFADGYNLDGTVHYKEITKNTLAGLNFDPENKLYWLTLFLFTTNNSIIQKRDDLVKSVYQDNLEQFIKDSTNAFKNNVISEKLTQMNTLLEQMLASANQVLSTEQKEAIQTMKILLNNDEDPADLISQLLNAATDNAKELILGKINAGMNLAGVHGYFMIMGFGLSDIINLMNTPAVRLLNTLSKPNMFVEGRIQFNNVKRVLDHIIKKEPEDYFSKVFDDFTNTFSNYFNEYGDIYSTIQTIFKQSPIYKLSNGNTIQWTDKGIKYHKNNTNEIYKTDQKLRNFLSQDLYQEIKDHYKAIYNSEFIGLLTAFKAAHRGARETTAAAQLIYKLNQGIISDIIEELKYENRVNKFISDMEEILPDIKELEDIARNKKYNNISGYLSDGDTTTPDTRKYIDLKRAFSKVLEKHPQYSLKYIAEVTQQAIQAGIYKNFSFYEYILNRQVIVKNLSGQEITTDYRTIATKYYNLIKDSFNIFDSLNHSRQFSEYLHALQSKVISENAISVKNRAIRNFYEKLVKEKVYLDDSTIASIKAYIDQQTITSFVMNMQYVDENQDQHRFTVPIKSGDKAFLKNGGEEDNTRSTNTDLVIEDIDSIASFKYWIHKTLVPSLKNGQYWDGSQMQTFENNAFIKYLVERYDKDVPYLTVDMNMNNIEATKNALLKFNEIQTDFQKLFNYKIGTTNLGDVFMMYNLITTRNTYGKNKFTRLFQNRLSLDERNIKTPNWHSSLLYQWEAYVGYLDKDNIQEFVNQKDWSLEDKLKFLGITTDGFLQYIAPHVSSYKEGFNHPYYWIKDLYKINGNTSPTYGQYVLVHRYKNNEGKWVSAKVSYIETTNLTPKQIAIKSRNRLEFYSPENSIASETKSTLAKLDDNKLGPELLNKWSTQGLVKILINCA